MCLCLYANEGHKSTTMDSVYHVHLKFQSCFSKKKAYYTHANNQHSPQEDVAVIQVLGHFGP